MISSRPRVCSHSISAFDACPLPWLLVQALDSLPFHAEALVVHVEALVVHAEALALHAVAGHTVLVVEVRLAGSKDSAEDMVRTGHRVPWVGIHPGMTSWEAESNHTQEAKSR